LSGFLKEIKRNLLGRKLLFVNIVNILVKGVVQDFVMLVIQTKVTHVLNVEKLVYKIKS
jgi:hypothetical protein